MEFLQQAAGNYLQGHSGGDAGKHNQSEGLDWSNLSNLAGKFLEADTKVDGELDVDTFNQHLNSSGGGYHHGRPQGYKQESYGAGDSVGYGKPSGGGYGGRPESGYGGRLESGYDRPSESYGGRPQGGYDGKQEQGYVRPQGYNSRPEEGYGGRPEGGYSRPQEQGYGRPQEQGHVQPQGYGRLPESEYNSEGYGGRPGGGYDRPQEQMYDRPHGDYGSGGPPPGYPSGGGASHESGGHSKPQGANPDILHQLLGKFQQEHGEQFTGGDSQYHQLAQLASKLTGEKIPAPMLEKLISWQLGGKLGGK